MGRLIDQSGNAAEGSAREVRSARARSFRAKRGKKKFTLIFSYQGGLSWHIRTLKTRKRRFQTIYLKPSISSSINRGHVAANRSDGRAAEFVNIGRNVVVASKSIDNIHYLCEK